MAQPRTDHAERPHVLSDDEHYWLLAEVFRSIADQGRLTGKVAALGGFQAVKARGLLVRRPRAVIVDMDGTLANVESIRHHVLRPNRDFDAFHAASVDVPVNEWVRHVAVEAHTAGVAVLIVTARKARWRHHTAWFLALHGIPSDALIMRADSDQRSDVEVKRSMLNDWIRPAWTPVLAVDDNPAIIELWRGEGIPTMQVPGWVDENS